MGTDRTSTLLVMLGQCDCAQRAAVWDAALESFFATYTFVASAAAAESAVGDVVSRAVPPQSQHLSARQQEALKRILSLQGPGLLIFGRMLPACKRVCA